MPITPSTSKVRRDFTGGKRPEGHRLQAAAKTIHRPNPERLKVLADDPKLTRFAGLASFGAFLRRHGTDRVLREKFGHLKQHPNTVYRMADQLRLFIDANVAGEPRVFGLESLAADALFTHLAGGTVPSVDVLYDDLARFNEQELTVLEELVAREGLNRLREAKPKTVHIDVDTTVEVLFGQQEGALPGPNPRYHGRPSYHPVLAYCPEVGMVVGAKLRPGDTGLGQNDVDTIVTWVRRIRAAVGEQCAIYVRVDAAGDYTALLTALAAAKVHFAIKGRMTRDIRAGISEIHPSRWETAESDADGKATLQWAWVPIQRQEWLDADCLIRVVAVRSTERYTGKQISLWADNDFTVQAYITNDWGNPGDVIQSIYDQRAGIEPVIGELKSGWGIGKVPTRSFDANHAAFLLKLLAYNLFRLFVEHVAPRVEVWRTPWLRRALIHVAGRLCRGAGRTWILRTAPTPAFAT